MKPSDVASYVFLAIAWGLSFLVLLHLVEAFDWVGAVAFRALVAGATLVLLALVTGRRLDFRMGLGPLAVVGATTVAAQLIGLSFALPRIGTAMSAIIVATIPLFSMLIGQVLGIERIAGAGRAGVALGFVGIVLLVGFPAVPFTASFAVGCVSSVLSAIAAAGGSLYVSHRLRGFGTWEVTIGAFLLGGAMTLPLLAVVPVPRAPGLVDIAYLLVAGCLMSALTYVLYFRLVSRIGATRAISVEFAVTVVAVSVGALWLRETLSPVQVAGGAVIVLGCALVLGLLPVGRRGERSPPA